MNKLMWIGLALVLASAVIGYLWFGLGCLVPLIIGCVGTVVYIVGADKRYVPPNTNK